jgi:ribose/xylose/arabinose/galactoside ABC-type transport system permease subunit
MSSAVVVLAAVVVVVVVGMLVEVVVVLKVALLIGLLNFVLVVVLVVELVVVALWPAFWTGGLLFDELSLRPLELFPVLFQRTESRGPRVAPWLARTTARRSIISPT